MVLEYLKVPLRKLYTKLYIHIMPVKAIFSRNVKASKCNEHYKQ